MFIDREGKKGGESDDKEGFFSFWIVFLIGALSYLCFFVGYYGAIVVMVVTFLCGLLTGVIAIRAKELHLIVWSVLLILSPHIVFVMLSLF